MMQKETTHRVWVIFTGRLLSRARCSIRQVYHTHSHSVNQPLRTGSALRNRIWRGNVYVDGTREVELNKEGEETRQKSRERVTEKVRRRERGNKSWSFKYRQECGDTSVHIYQSVGVLILRVARRLYQHWDCVTHPSPSFSRTSKTSSGCLVRLSSLSFFSCLWRQRDVVGGGGDREEGDGRRNWKVSVWILQGVAAVSLIDKSAVKSLDSLIRRVFCFVWPTIQNPKKNCLHA